jgi:hypothetical protein
MLFLCISVYGTPERENPGVYNMFSICSLEYTFSDSIRCVSKRFVNVSLYAHFAVFFFTMDA